MNRGQILPQLQSHSGTSCAPGMGLGRAWHSLETNLRRCLCMLTWGFSLLHAFAQQESRFDPQHCFLDKGCDTANT